MTLALRGELLVVGKQPDGDSVRFAPETPELLDRLDRAERVRLSSVDGSVQLRLDGIDAPETHYEGRAQPLGDAARDRLLELCGFRDVRRTGQTVDGATPDRVPAAILAGTVDPNGRPVAFLLTGDALPADGADTDAAELLWRTANTALLADGSAYLTLYASTAVALRDAMRATSTSAAARREGVWAADASHDFDVTAVGPGGSLVLPKLFRRCTDYVATRTPGETLAHWMATHGKAARPEDDGVSVGGGPVVPFSSLLTQDGDRVGLTASPLDLVFAEK